MAGLAIRLGRGFNSPASYWQRICIFSKTALGRQSRKVVGNRIFATLRPCNPVTVTHLMIGNFFADVKA